MKSVKATLIVSLALTIIPPLTAHTIFPIFYHLANDDSVMSLYCAGAGITDTPDGHVYYIHYGLAALLAALNVAMPAVNWYYGLACLIHLAATLSLCYIFVRRSPGVMAMLGLTLYITTFDLYFWIHPQFTITAYLAAQSAVYVGLHVFCSPGASFRRIGLCYGLSLVLLALSFMYRKESTLLAVCLAGPLVAALGMQYATKKAALAFGTFAILCAITLGVLSLCHAHVFERDEEWAEFPRYNWLRGCLTEYLPASQSCNPSAALAQVGLTTSDWEIFRRSFFYDDTRFSPATLDRLLACLRRHDGDAVDPNRGWLAPLRRLGEREYRPWLISLLALFCVVPMRWESLCRTGIVITTSATVLVLLACNLKLELRVIVPVLAFLATYSVFEQGLWHDDRSRTGIRRNVTWAGAIGLLLGAVALGDAAVLGRDRYRLVSGRHDAYVQSLNELAADYGDALIVDWGGAMRYDHFAATATVQPFKKLNVVLILLYTRTPFTKARFARYGIDDPYKAFFERNDVILVTWESFLPALVAYIQDHYNVQTEPVIVRRYGMFTAYRLSVVGRPGIQCKGVVQRESR